MIKSPQLLSYCLLELIMQMLWGCCKHDTTQQLNLYIMFYITVVMVQEGVHGYPGSGSVYVGWQLAPPSSRGDCCYCCCCSFLGLPPQLFKHNFTDWCPWSVHVFKSWFTCSGVFRQDLFPNSAHGMAVQSHQQNQRQEGAGTSFGSTPS